MYPHTYTACTDIFSKEQALLGLSLTAFVSKFVRRSSGY